MKPPNACEDLEKNRSLNHITCGNVKWYRHSGKQFGSFLKKWNLSLRYYLSITTLGFVPEKQICSHKNLYMNDLSSFVIAPNWKQPRYPLIGEWFSKPQYIHPSGMLLSENSEKTIGLHDHVATQMNCQRLNEWK